MRQCANKDVGLRRGYIERSHIDWKRERVPAKTLGLEKRVDCEIPRWLEKRMKHFFL